MARSTRGGGRKSGAGADGGAEPGAAGPARKPDDPAQPPTTASDTPTDTPSDTPIDTPVTGAGGAKPDVTHSARSSTAASDDAPAPSVGDGAEPTRPAPRAEAAAPPPRPAEGGGPSRSGAEAPPAGVVASGGPARTPPGPGASAQARPAGPQPTEPASPAGEAGPEAGKAGAETPAKAAGAADRPAASETRAADTARSQTTPGRDTPSPASVAAAPRSRAGGFVALVLGGLLAAFIGAAAALYLFPHGWWTDTVELERRVAALEARPVPPDAAAMEQAIDQAIGGALAPLGQRVEALEALEPADVAALEERLATLSERLDAAAAIDLEAVESRLQNLAARIEAAEAGAPGPDLGPLEGAVEDLAGRLAAIEQNREDEIAAAAGAAVEAALEEAYEAQEARARELDQAAETLAADQARLAAQGALTELSVAAESGAPAPDALARLAAVAEPPAAMQAFAEGVPTLAALQAAFPDHARRALNAAPVAQDAPLGERALNFLRAQTGARSLAPRAGDDPDAVLSRAEAAVRDGRLADALDEIAALPPAAAAEIEPWRARAERRLAALEALAAMQARLGSEQG